MSAESINRPLQVALRHGAESWREQDPDPATREELTDLLHRAGEVSAPDDVIDRSDTSDRADAWRALHDRFHARLEFGTAGLRGELGAGPNRMNRVLVGQAARGFADYLLEREDAPTIVVGYDARINSDVFARDTAEIMQAAGVRATLLPRQLPTPVLAFAVRHLGASAGVMVTASHNPKRDNGYKVYLGAADGGSQIVAPADLEIATAIAQVANARKLPEIPRDDAYAIADESVVDAYVAATAQEFHGRPNDLKWVYTPMHGVGLETFFRVLDRLGIRHPAVVAAQAEPDGAFPTLDFPNPEEPGALDLAFAAAETTVADLVVAHDPDADRLAIAIPHHGEWRRFGGNDVGKLLGWRAAEAVHAAGGSGTLATSLVSSPALGAVARAYDLDYAETPTGFKWISRAPGLVFGYEEALGYLVDPEKVHDKDGLSAAVAILELAMRLADEDRTLADLEADFADRFGSFASRQVSTRFAAVSEIPRIMAALRASLPTEVGGVAVSTVEDLLTGIGEIPPSDILRLWLEDGTRVMVRPSGTEPKIKIYIDAEQQGDDPVERDRAANAAADGAADAMRALLAAL